MRIIRMGRASGKTMKVIHTAELTGAIIICANQKAKRNIIELAMSMRCCIIEPVVASKIEDIKSIHSPILIDDLDLVLASLFGSMPIAATITES